MSFSFARQRRYCAPPAGTTTAIRIIDSPTSPTPPAAPIGWRVAPLRTSPGGRWLAWDARILRAVAVFEIATPQLCEALWATGYQRAASHPTFEVWVCAKD